MWNLLTNSADGIDDPRDLPPQYAMVYKNPYRIFGLDEHSADIAAVRDAFRKACVSFVTFFSDLGKSKSSLKQIIFAYQLIRGNIKGPAKQLREVLESSPFLDFRAEDILPLLRPMKSSFECAKEYRGFRMLNVSAISTQTSFVRSLEIPFMSQNSIATDDKDPNNKASYVPYLGLPRILFTFDVNYCLRRHYVERDFDECLALHKQIVSEMVAVPGFPDSSFLQSTLGIATSELGVELSNYFMRLHQMLAAKGLFSPRLLKFLGIDFERVHSEEEGIIMSILDTPFLPRSSAWHIVDEDWLGKWRKFVMGRGARRYFPPGRITNRWLYDEYKRGGRRSLIKAKDYRAVNYNVWRFYELVHGGGPCISRKEDHIYSAYGVSDRQGIIMIQTRIRIYLAMSERERLFTALLSQGRTARAVMFEVAIADLKNKVDVKIANYQQQRRMDRVEEAARFTQQVWRKKKHYAPEESLRRHKKDQEVFSRTSAMLAEDTGTSADGLVVVEVKPIINFGSAHIYEATVEEETMTLPFKTKRIAGTEMAAICECANDFIPDSRIVSINSYPSSSMTYEEIKDRLKTVSWPVVLELEMPLRLSHLPSLDTIVALEVPELQYNAFKLLLRHGIQIIKHNSNNSKFHPTTVKINEYQFFYRSKSNPKKSDEQLWKRFSLFDMKFIVPGYASETMKAKSKKRNKSKNTAKHLDIDACFEIVTEDRVLCFEVSKDDTFGEVGSSDMASYNNNDGKETSERAIEGIRKRDQETAKKLAENLRKDYIESIRVYLERLSTAEMSPTNSGLGIDTSISQTAAEVVDEKLGGESASGSEDNDDEEDDDDEDEDDEDGEEEEDQEEAEKKKSKSKHELYCPQDVVESLQTSKLFSISNANSKPKQGKSARGKSEPQRKLSSLDPKEVYKKIKSATMVSMFQMLVQEIRKGQNGIDEFGVPTRRGVAKTSLRKVD